MKKNILTKTISRLYQADSEFSKIQKDKLLLKYQHQLGIVLAKLEKLEQASDHPDLGPVGDGLITLMDQKLSKLDDRLYEISSKMLNSKVETSKKKESEKKPEPKEKFSKVFNFDKPKEEKIESTEDSPTKSRQSFELTTLTNVSKKEPKFPSFEKEEVKQIMKPMPQPKIIQTELIKPKEKIVEEIIQPKEKIVEEIIQPKPKVEDKMDIIQSVIKPDTTFETKPDLNKEVAKLTEHKALTEHKPKPVTLDDDFDDDADDLDKIKGDIMKVLAKLDQAEVE